jgi:hypothetical protein
MAISYAEFLTQVRNFTEVESNVLSDTLVEQFIRNIELDVSYKVDYDDVRKYATSSFNVGKRYVVMPADFLTIRSMQVILADGSRAFMEKRDTSFISEYNGQNAAGVPKYYANWDETNVVVAPTPDTAYVVQLNYTVTPPHFTASNSTYLSNYSQNMLLHGVLAEAYSYLKGPMDIYNLYKKQYDDDVQGFALQQMGKRRRAEYDDGVPRMVIPSPSPNRKTV